MDVCLGHKKNQLTLFVGRVFSVFVKKSGYQPNSIYAQANFILKMIQ